MDTPDTFDRSTFGIPLTDFDFIQAQGSTQVPLSARAVVLCNISRNEMLEFRGLTVGDVAKHNTALYQSALDLREQYLKSGMSKLLPANKPRFTQFTKVRVTAGLPGMEGREGHVTGIASEGIVDMWIVDFGECVSEVYEFTCGVIPHMHLERV